jgi:hypothetical protein
MKVRNLEGRGEETGHIHAYMMDMSLGAIVVCMYMLYMMCMCPSLSSSLPPYSLSSSLPPYSS